MFLTWTLPRSAMRHMPWLSTWTSRPNSVVIMLNVKQTGAPLPIPVLILNVSMYKLVFLCFRNKNLANVFFNFMLKLDAPADKDFQCETRDLIVAECHWTVGRSTGLGKTRTLHWLLGRYNKYNDVAALTVFKIYIWLYVYICWYVLLSLYSSQCKDGSQGRCSIKIPAKNTETKWTLKVTNQLGKVELTDVADMAKRGTALYTDLYIFVW